MVFCIGMRSGAAGSEPDTCSSTCEEAIYFVLLVITAVGAMSANVEAQTCSGEGVLGVFLCLCFCFSASWMLCLVLRCLEDQS